MHTTSSIIPCACGIEEATDTNAQTILSQHEIRISLRVGVSVRDRTMVRFRGFHRARVRVRVSVRVMVRDVVRVRVRVTG